jgi:hypothetical protein
MFTSAVEALAVFTSAADALAGTRMHIITAR